MNLLLYGVVALAILGTLAGIGYKVRQSGYDSCKVEWTEAASAQTKREQELSAFAAKALADERAKRKVVTKEVIRNVEKIVERPVYRNVCLDDAGLSCLQSAINGKVDSGCKPDSPMPAARPSDGKGR